MVTGWDSVPVTWMVELVTGVGSDTTTETVSVDESNPSLTESLNTRRLPPGRSGAVKVAEDEVLPESATASPETWFQR